MKSGTEFTKYLFHKEASLGISKFLTIDHIYYPLAQSNGKILELVRANKAKDGDRKKKLFVFLSEIGTKALRMQLGRVLGMAETSATQEEYEKKKAKNSWFLDTGA